MARAMDRVWHMEIPKDWEAQLRAFSPIRYDMPWLALRWFPMERQVRDGSWRDCGRWVMYECLHESIIPEYDRDIVNLLAGPQPSRIHNPNEAQAKMMFANDYQCMMYRKHKVWARNCWIIQGSSGGHPIEYDVLEKAILQACGLPTDPPPLGTLPYAPFDERVINALRKRSRVTKYGSYDAAKRHATPEVVEREMQEAERAFREWHVKHLEESLAPSVDFLDWYTSSSKTSTECRNTLPGMSAEEQTQAEIANDRYIETGDYGHMDITNRLVKLPA